MRIQILLTVLLLVFIQKTHAQFLWCNDFEESNLNTFIEDSNSLWQIGKPDKAVFDGSYSGNFSIVTDTANSYTANDTSVFIVSHAGFWDYLGVYAPIQVEFKHRFDMDSLTEYGKIEISVDSGLTWINLLDATCSSSYDNSLWSVDYKPEYNSHALIGTSDTLFDSLVITGRSNGWRHSIITKDINCLKNLSNRYDVRLLIKFTFYSDSIETNKDGWQIDDLCLHYLWYWTILNIENYMNNSKIKIYPNPVKNELNVILKNKIGDDYKIYDAIGSLVSYGVLTSLQQSIDIRELNNGLYFIHLRSDDKEIIKKFLKK